MVLTAVAGVLALSAFMLARAVLYGPPDLPAPAAPAAIEMDLDGAAGRLAAGIRVRTISMAGQPTAAQAFHDLSALLEDAFPRVHATMSREKIAGHSLLYRWQGRQPELTPVLFSAHMDVVPADPETLDAWTHPPFSGQIADGAIWGRGALDMKQSLFAIMEAAEILLAAGHIPERTILFAFTHDEELGGSAAAAIAATLAERGERLHMTMDEGLMITEGIVPGVEAPVALIGVAHKGYLTLEITSHGAGGHSSMPPRETAVSRLAAALAALTADPPGARLQSPATDMFASLGPELPFAQRLALANAWAFEPFMLSVLSDAPATNAIVRTTVAPTMFEGGLAENVLPQSASATINFRLLPGDTVDATVEHVRRTIADPSIDIRVVGTPAPASAVSDLWSAGARPLVDAARQVFPDALVAPGLSVALSDTRHYAGIADQSFFFLPSRVSARDLERIHGVDERIPLEDYGKMIRFYAQLMLNLSAASAAD